MKKIIYYLFFMLLSLNVFPQKKCPDKGNNKGQPGCPDPSNGCKDVTKGKEFSIPVIGPIDPNEIIGPLGYDTAIKWVSINTNLGYKILFENSPDFATAPAQNVTLYLPIPLKLNPNSVRIGDFGFGNFVFTVPANTSSYTTRLDLTDSLGVLIDVIAGLDITNNRAFWIFQSIDPATGLGNTLPSNAGFLPVNDTTKGNGEGFVTFTIQPVDDAQTRDTANAKASIIFDTENPIPTNIWLNTIDAVAPVSKITSFTTSANNITLSWSGSDDANGSGVRDYALYVSKNDGPFSLSQDTIHTTTTSFDGAAGNTYKFFTRATDNTGNREALKTQGEVTVQLGPCPVEICDGVDNDCDDLIDEGFDKVTYYEDKDGDRFGNINVTKDTCSIPDGYVTDNTDCNDNDPNVHEGCGGLTYFKDGDGDNYGDPEISVIGDTQPNGYVTNNTDCNDDEKTIHPGATEICNGIDDNCDGQIDEGLLSILYRDTDNDGYGNVADTIHACSTVITGYVSDSTDCNDNPANGGTNIHPGATEKCNSIDDNCDGKIDEGCPVNSLPIVKIINPTKDTSYIGLATIQLSAEASDVDGSIQSVDFYNGNKLIFSTNTAPYTGKWHNVPLGNHLVTAKATDNAGAVTSSPVVHISVLPHKPVIVKGPGDVKFPWKWPKLKDKTNSPTDGFNDNNPGGKASELQSRVNSKTIKNKAATLILVPNPATNVLNVYTTGLQKDKQLTVSILSSLGVVVETRQSTSFTEVIQLNVSSLVSGVYTIKVLSGDKVLYKQFVKL